MSVLANILIYLDEKDIKHLSEQSVRLNYSIVELYQDNNFWKQKVEILLNKDFGDLRVDWYDVYENIYDIEKNKLQDNLPGILIEAAKYGDFGTVKVLILFGVDPTTNNNLAIQLASQNGYTEIVKLLLQQLHLKPGFAGPKVDPTADNNYAILSASENGHLKIMRLLLQHGADPRVNKDEIMDMAIRRDNAAMVKLLLEYGANPTDVLYRAIQTGKLEMVKLLLQYGADPTANDNAAIKNAVRFGTLKMVKLLLQHGADPTANNNEAIQIARQSGKSAMVNLLLNH